MGRTLYEKVFDRHVIHEFALRRFELSTGLNLSNEVSRPSAFQDLRERGLTAHYGSKGALGIAWSSVDARFPLKLLLPCAAQRTLFIEWAIALDESWKSVNACHKANDAEYRSQFRQETLGNENSFL